MAGLNRRNFSKRKRGTQQLFRELSRSIHLPPPQTCAASIASAVIPPLLPGLQLHPYTPNCTHDTGGMPLTQLPTIPQRLPLQQQKPLVPDTAARRLCSHRGSQALTPAAPGLQHT